MAGTTEGAKKAVETKRQKYGEKFFAENGHKGGLARNESSKKYNPFEDKEFARKMAHKAKAKRWPETSLTRDEVPEVIS